MSSRKYLSLSSEYSFCPGLLIHSLRTSRSYICKYSYMLSTTSHDRGGTADDPDLSITLTRSMDTLSRSGKNTHISMISNSVKHLWSYTNTATGGNSTRAAILSRWAPMSLHWAPMLPHAFKHPWPLISYPWKWLFLSGCWWYQFSVIAEMRVGNGLLFQPSGAQHSCQTWARFEAWILNLCK